MKYEKFWEISKFMRAVTINSLPGLKFNNYEFEALAVNRGLGGVQLITRARHIGIEHAQQ